MALEGPFGSLQARKESLVAPSRHTCIPHAQSKMIFPSEEREGVGPHFLRGPQRLSPGPAAEALGASIKVLGALWGP